LRPVVGGGGRWVRVAPLRRDCRRRVIACQVIDRALACARVIVFFWVRSCLYVKSDSVHICTETFFIFQEILRARSDFGALMQFDRRPMALPYPYGRRLEADHIHFSGRSLHQPTDVGLTMGNDLLKVGCNLDKFWFSSARSIQILRPIRFHRIAIQSRFP
jgi:hypothetical protein